MMQSEYKFHKKYSLIFKVVIFYPVKDKLPDVEDCNNFKKEPLISSINIDIAKYRTVELGFKNYST